MCLFYIIETLISRDDSDVNVNPEPTDGNLTSIFSLTILRKHLT